MQAPPDATQSQGPPKRSNTALIVTLTIVGVSCLCCILVLPAVLFPVFAQANQAAKRASARNRMRQVCLATLMYAEDNDQKLPLDLSNAEACEPALTKYGPDTTLYVSINPAGGTILGNSSLSGKLTTAYDSPSSTVLFYDSIPWKTDRQLVGFLSGKTAFEAPSEFRAQLAATPIETYQSATNKKSPATH